LERVQIGKNFEKQPTWIVRMGVSLIYLPLIITVPFVILGILAARGHLKFVNATGI